MRNSDITEINQNNSAIGQNGHFDRNSNVNGSPIVVLNKVSKTYRMGDLSVHALKKISLEIPKGQILFIMGPSGSGKTTLLNLIGGIDTPTSGEIMFEQNQISNYSAKELTKYRKNHLAFVFQFYSLIPTLKVKENVELTMELMKFSKTKREEEVNKYLQMVGLWDRRNNFPSQLSGGERQRVAIARALSKHPQVFLVDEPTGQLDQDTGFKITQSIREIAKAKNTTVILVTHDPEMKQFADRVIQMRSGEIISDTIMGTLDGGV